MLEENWDFEHCIYPLPYPPSPLEEGLGEITPEKMSKKAGW